MHFRGVPSLKLQLAASYSNRFNERDFDRAFVNRLFHIELYKIILDIFYIFFDRKYKEIFKKIVM